MTSLSETVRQSLWAKLLTPEQLARADADMVERTYPAGGFLCHKGEMCEWWFGVIEGLVKINTVSREGKSVTFTSVPQGGWLGEGSLLKHELRKYDVVALRPSRIACMPRATFDWLLDHSIGFNRFLLNQINERLGQMIGMVEYDRLLDPDARVARCLASLFNPYLYPGIGHQLQISQEEIGYLSGASRQRVNQALQVLERAGLIRVEYGGITVLDFDGLQRYAA